jgi:hypothetical protein
MNCCLLLIALLLPKVDFIGQFLLAEYTIALLATV